MARRPSFRLSSPKFQLSENDVEKACITILGTRGYRHERIHSGVFQTLDGRRVIHGAKKGTPDYLAVHPRHRGFYLEVKRPGGELSPEQQLKITEIRQGWRIAVAVVDSAAQLSAWLDTHEQPNEE